MQPLRLPHQSLRSILAMTRICTHPVSFWGIIDAFLCEESRLAEVETWNTLNVLCMKFSDRESLSSQDNMFCVIQCFAYDNPGFFSRYAPSEWLCVCLHLTILDCHVSRFAPSSQWQEFLHIPCHSVCVIVPCSFMLIALPDTNSIEITYLLCSCEIDDRIILLGLIEEALKYGHWSLSIGINVFAFWPAKMYSGNCPWVSR